MVRIHSPRPSSAILASPSGLSVQYNPHSRTMSIGASDLFLLSFPCPILGGKGLHQGMVLKLTGDEVQEVHRALSEVHLQVLRELSRVDGYVNRRAGLDLCQRKWNLEALLHQLAHSDDPHPVLELVPAGQTPSGLVTKESEIEDGTTETEINAADRPQRYRTR